MKQKIFKIIIFLGILISIPVIFFFLFREGDNPPLGNIIEKPLYNIKAKGSPGDFLKSRPAKKKLQAKESGKVETIFYISEAGASSGLLFLPPGKDYSQKPLLLFQHGMAGLADRCAPSNADRSIDPLSLFYRDAFAYWLQEGYAIAMPDDPGLGTPGRYRLGMQKVQSDGAYRMFQALAREYGFSDYVNLGHSQGGQGAMDLSRTPGIKKPLASIIYSPASFLETQVKVGSAILTKPSQGAALLFLLLYSAVWESGTDPREIFAKEVFLTDGAMSKEGLSLWERAESDCLTELVDAFLAPDAISAGDLLKTRDWKNMPKIEKVLRSMQPQAKDILLLQGGRDDIVFPEITRELVRDLRFRGVRVTYKEFPKARHQDIVLVSSDYVLRYIQKISGRGDSSG